jgi:hypothetical protein
MDYSCVYFAVTKRMNLLILAIFAGFEGFTRGNVSWSYWVLDWGYTLAPFGVIAGFLMLLGLSRFVLGSEAFQVPLESKMDLKTQQARRLAPLPDSRFTWRTALHRVLNY